MIKQTKGPNQDDQIRPRHTFPREIDFSFSKLHHQWITDFKHKAKPCQIERAPMTAVEPPGDDTINDASSNALPDTTTKRKILNYLNVRIM
jgi:hypothetical protein